MTHGRDLRWQEWTHTQHESLSINIQTCSHIALHTQQTLSQIAGVNAFIYESLTTDTQTEMVTIACYVFIHVQGSHESKTYFTCLSMTNRYSWGDMIHINQENIGEKLLNWGKSFNLMNFFHFQSSFKYLSNDFFVEFFPRKTFQNLKFWN